MEAPERINPTRLGDYLEIMTKTVMQTGISWKVVNNKWPGIREAFRDFDIDTVANFGEQELDDLTNDTRVIRNRRKLEAIVYNAQKIIALDEEHGNFQKYLRSHDDYKALVKDMRKQFKFLGDMGSYYFLYVVGEEVPPHEEVMVQRKSA